MKKLYTITSFVLVSVISFAQVTNISFPEPTEISTKTFKSNNIYSSSAEKSTPFWSEDFSDGIPLNWEEGHAGGTASAPWIYRGPNTTPDVNTGSQGAYRGSQGPITSPTAANGFMIFDSDYYDNGGNVGAFGTGQYPANTPAIPGHVGTLITDTIDCSIYPHISIVFNSFYRTFAGNAQIAFSNDGGATFTTPIDVHPGVDVNEQTSNDYEIMIRMPDTIAGSTTVKMKFIYDGFTTAVGGYYGYYFWMIDDIRLIETPKHLLNLGDETFGGWWIGYQANQGLGYDLGIDYTFNPIKQVTANPYRLEAVVSNDGYIDQNTCQLHVDVSTLSSSVFYGSSAGTTIYNNDNDTLVTSTDFTPTSLGLHEINFWASSDSFPTSDTISRTTIVTDTIYGIDFDWDSDGANAGSGEKLGRSCGGQVLGNAFDIYADDTATSISFHLHGESVPGAELTVELYEIDPFVTPYAPVYLGTSDDYEILESDTNTWVTIKLSDPVNLYAGVTYIAAVKGRVNPIDTSLISRTYNNNTLSFIQDNGCNMNSANPIGTWYSASNRAFMIRLNVGYEVASSLDEDIFDGKLSVHPNPSKGIFNIDLVNVKNGDYLISVSNILGEEVYSETKGVNSTTSTTINLSGLESGIYMLNIQNGDSSISKKLIIE